MNIGFTGSRDGLSPRQIDGINGLLRSLTSGNHRIHHGYCKGADEQIHKIAKELRISIVGHPPIKIEYKANISEDDFYHIFGPMDYQQRDREIVSVCAYMVATPKSMEDKSGGTWYTINYARVTAKKPCFILEP